ncbi:tRNA (adenosine(37)-N6)-threonylcarbamoyltransferase complex ATPase subunit type 1 TsaE [Aureimonas populi]|uniref:tRNA threonylcarbamoyladenosine biosynthesis protein TsaE n=1 Tax=Aureimonas populi TaxID=1701758 RepID=A0ABW5CNE8_9HYPH|nr:tRNA (adenosine(37)-N6)-threonylcarbamoyltransferase complex ATPase subunit type 1 TsaE [Aureimonas populi]
MSQDELPAPLADGFTMMLEGEEASHRLAQDFAVVMRTGDMLALSGELGAGKTTFARALLRHLAGDDALEVPSPTYTLVQTYETRPKATHFDLYRIGGEDDLVELGFEEAAETGLVLVEWPERSTLVMEEANIHLTLSGDSPERREATVLLTPEAAARVERSLAVRAFLRAAGHGTAHRRPFPADASARRYEHIENADASLVLMDAPANGPVSDAARLYAQTAHLAQEVLPFVALAETLEARGFSTPHIVAADLSAGLVLMEYLGDEGILDAAGRPIAERYEAAALCLAELHARPFGRHVETSDGLAYEIPDFDRAAMMVEVGLLVDWAFPRIKGRRASEEERAAFANVWNSVFDALAGTETNLLLRDFHSPNILWQGEREGCRRIGLLDFQDAMIGPTAYDLASLAQDVRVDMPAELEARLLAAYRAARSTAGPFDTPGFDAAYAAMAAQRATKILGIFVRLHERDGKPQYLRHLPRIRAYLRRTLGHPVLAPVAALYEEWGILADD